MMKPNSAKQFNENTAWLAANNVPPNQLRAKYRRAGTPKGVAEKTGGNSGGTGRAGKRRKRGWRKHGTRAANVSR